MLPAAVFSLLLPEPVFLQPQLSLFSVRLPVSHSLSPETARLFSAEPELLSEPASKRELLLWDVPACLLLPALQVSVPVSARFLQVCFSDCCSEDGIPPRFSFSAAVPVHLPPVFHFPQDFPVRVQLFSLQVQPDHLTDLTGCFLHQYYSSAIYPKPLYSFFLNLLPIHSPSHSLPPFLFSCFSIAPEKPLSSTAREALIFLPMACPSSSFPPNS